MVAVGQGAAQLVPGLAAVMVGQELGRPVGAAIGVGTGCLAGGAHAEGEQALDLEEGPVGGPAEGATRPHTASPDRMYVQLGVTEQGLSSSAGPAAAPGAYRPPLSLEPAEVASDSTHLAAG